MDFMGQINLIWNKSENYGMIQTYILLNIMQIGYKIFINVIGRVLILVSMIGIVNNNKILLENLRKMDFYQVDKFIQDG